MNKLAYFLFAPGLLLSQHAARADPPATPGEQARAILATYCAGCHGGGKAVKGGFGFVLDRDLLVSRLLVLPGKASQSDLFLRIQQGEMPPPSRKERPSPAELKILQAWIDAGAPAFEKQLRTGQVLAENQVAGIILADLDKLDPRRRRFTRYLTLTHLAFAGRPEKDLQTVREAAGKLLNSLSWHPRLGLPEAVNVDATILRIDLRAYKWNAALWEKLATAYPYRFDDAEQTRLFVAQTGAEVVAVRADWFVATASRPPLYHDLLQLPGTDRALERLLQVDVPGDVRDDNILRAGFNDSGVSKNNRLLERHDAAHGAFWRSYDFANNTGRQNLFEHPVGPSTGEVSFRPAGGEMIWHLPNGLQAYMLVDALGRRIDKAPSDIVADPRRPDQRVETGISCMSCHARGLLFKADQLRAHVEKNAQVFGKDIVETIRSTHPRKAKFQAQIDEDNVRYLQAMARFGVRDPDQEPVNLVTQRFEATLDRAAAAAELGLTPGQFYPFLQRHGDLGRIFGSLLVDGGTVQREVFQRNFVEMARRLRADQIAGARPRPAPSFQGHAGMVHCVAFSPDGQLAASAGDDRTIRLWEVAGKELALLQGSSGEVYAIAWSSDGKFLISGGRDRLVRLWDVQARKQVRTFQGHTASVRCVAFSHDGKSAISGGDDRTLRIWDVADGQEKTTLVGHTGPVSSAVWSSSDYHVLSGSLHGSVRWWDLASQKEISRLEGHAGPVLSVALAPDGKSALSGGNDKTARLWSVIDAKELHCFKGHASAVIRVKFDASGQHFFSSGSQHKSADRTWRRWNVTDRKEIASLAAGEGISFGCAAFSPDGQQVLVGGPGGFVRIWTWQGERRTSAP